MKTENLVREQATETKACASCAEHKPLSEFLRRSGGKDGVAKRRGTCRDCRRRLKETDGTAVSSFQAVPFAMSAPAAAEAIETVAERTETKKKRRRGKKAKAAEVQEAEQQVVDAVADPEPAEAPSETKPKRRRRKKRKAKQDESTVESAVVEAPIAQESVEEMSEAKPKRRRKRKRQAKGDKPAAASLGEVGEEAPPLQARKAKNAPPRNAIRAVPPAAVPISAMTIESTNALGLRPTKQGFIRMRGKTDNGRKWYQEIDPELAVTLVKERAAVVVNRHTIRRIYANKEFRRFVLERDEYTCYFCGQYGDTIDHMLPRAKGGHTTPDNCVCACNECNQSKADRDLDEFMGAQDQ